MPRAPGSGRDVTQTLSPCLLCGQGTRSRGVDNPGEQQRAASCSVVAKGGWGLLFVTFRQGRLQRQGPGGARESGAHLPFSVSQRAPLTVTGRGPLATLNLKGEERATRPCGWRPTGDSWWLPQSPPATPFPSPRPPPLPTSTEMLPGGQSPHCPPVPHLLLFQTVSLCPAGKKKQNLYSFLWQLHKYKYVGKYLQTPELKGDMQRELNYRLQGVIKQYLGFPRLVILFLFCMIYYAGKTFFSSQFLFIFFFFASELHTKLLH